MAAAGRLIVFKVGSSTLVDEAGSLDRVFIRSLCDQVVALREAGNQVVVVSSGAAAAGRDALGLSSRPSDIAALQACASVGQTALLELGAVTVVNENDTVSVAEFTFGDNDMLGAIVSALVGADLYIILSDVCGLYTANPSVDPMATLIPEVTQVDRSISAVAGDSSSSFGTGGMSSKVRAARGMMAAGIPTVICEGRRPRVLLDVAAGKSVGTRFRPPADATPEAGRKLWIGLAEVVHGTIELDEGAAAAVLGHGASILPVGVSRVEGTFEAGEVVNVTNPAGELIGRGVVGYSSDDMLRVRGLKLEVIARFLGEAAAVPAVHRDELLVL